MSKQEILLESGTNEVEIIEFLLGTQSFGVNVAKVREIIPYNPSAITAVPEVQESVLGMFILRDSTLPLVDLNMHLDLNYESPEDTRRVVLVCEFNDLVNGFLVDGVNQIHRCSWGDIIPLSPYISQYKPSITSSITIEERNIMIIDLEHIVADIYPQTRLVYSEEEDPEHAQDIPVRHNERKEIKIIMAEDSPIVRSSVKKITDEVGYVNIDMHDNGLSAYEEVAELAEKAKAEGKPITEYVDAVVTDIEMPQMDGMTVCRKIKDELGLTSLPVIVFSSLINEKMIMKCKSVGADAWANKLKVPDLVHILDKYTLGK